MKRTENLAQRAHTKELEQRSYFEISYRDPLCKSLQRGHGLAQQFPQRTCQGYLAHNLLQRSLQRELAESIPESLVHVLATLFGVSCRE